MPELELWAGSSEAGASGGASGGAGGGASKAALVKEIVVGEADDEIAVKFAIEAQSSAMLLSLECKVASIPFNPFRKQAFLLQRLRLNAPHETGGCGYLSTRGSEIFFVCAWREHRQQGADSKEHNLLLDSFLARARRFRKIFYQYTREQLREAHEEDILALERARGNEHGHEQRLATLKL